MHCYWSSGSAHEPPDILLNQSTSELDAQALDEPGIEFKAVTKNSSKSHGMSLFKCMLQWCTEFNVSH
jgi:hypothetical protein